MNDDTYEKARDPLKRYIARCPGAVRTPNCGPQARERRRSLQ